jgi:hypothetical protein
MWEPLPLTTLEASMACNRDIFTFTSHLVVLNTDNSVDPSTLLYYSVGLFMKTAIFQILGTLVLLNIGLSKMNTSLTFITI